MDSGAADSPVTLVIKAPNQKYEDQTINCLLNWTVEKLKSHISNVYPSRPLSKDQRLVYSGMLLQDHLQLRDVLRKQDGYHMMHLVCASHSPPGSPTPRSPSMATFSAPDSSVSSPSAASSTSAVPGSYDGLRYRGGFPQYNPQNPPGVPQWPDGAQVPLQGGLPANMPPHPMYMPMQMLWWQQMYARHYYMQYQAAVAASQPPSTPPPSSSPLQPAPLNEAVQPPLGPNPAPNPLPENQPANPNIQMNAQGGARCITLETYFKDLKIIVSLMVSSFRSFLLKTENHFYYVYVPVRHQAGWFPFRLEQQNLRGGDRAGAPQEEAERHQDIQEMERLMDEGMEDDDSGEEGGGAPEDQAQAAAVLPDPNFLTTIWSFISTFFTSLIPEGRPHPAN
uniref:Homocysteine-responsive endoplasmic reticulum-resident ubiquitin-like domain member 2 protein n=1 Tax=Monopterus albus TaxID=43700 RepID=A0A3Q3QDF3_MONAL